jgi:hypothetical protein
MARRGSSAGSSGAAPAARFQRGRRRPDFRTAACWPRRAAAQAAAPADGGNDAASVLRRAQQPRLTPGFRTGRRSISPSPWIMQRVPSLRRSCPRKKARCRAFRGSPGRSGGLGCSARSTAIAAVIIFLRRKPARWAARTASPKSGAGATGVEHIQAYWPQARGPFGARLSHVAGPAAEGTDLGGDHGGKPPIASSATSLCPLIARFAIEPGWLERPARPGREDVQLSRVCGRPACGRRGPLPRAVWCYDPLPAPSRGVGRGSTRGFAGRRSRP